MADRSARSVLVQRTTRTNRARFMIPTHILRLALGGFGLPNGDLHVLSRRFGKLCIAHTQPDGTRTQIRLVREQPDTSSRLGAEMRWLTHLSGAHRLRIPIPAAWQDGALVSPTLVHETQGAWRAIACSWVRGRHLNRGLRRAELRSAGELLARLHRANADVPAGIAEMRPHWWIPRLFELATRLRDVVAGEPEAITGLSLATVHGLQRSARALQVAYTELPTGTTHAGLIHTDAHWQNLRFLRDTVGIVDFEDFATSRFMLDVACFWNKLERRRGSEAMLDAVLAGYDAVSTLPAGFMRDLRVMLAFRRFDYAGWVLSWPRPDLLPWGPALLAEAPAYIERQLAY